MAYTILRYRSLLTANIHETTTHTHISFLLHNVCKGDPQSQKHRPDLGAMMKLPACKHKSLNIDTEDVAINTHEHMTQ